jgi:membrane protease YdiL (CAAX protease family)
VTALLDVGTQPDALSSRAGRPGDAVRVLGSVAVGLALARFTRVVFLAPLGVIAAGAVACSVAGGRRRGWVRLGLRRPASLSRTLAITLTLIVAAFAVSRLVARVVIPIWGPPDYGMLAAMVGHPLQIGLLLGINWTSAAFGEEIVFRGFLIPTIAGWCGNGRLAWSLGIVGSSALFGAVHAYQGVTGMVLTGAIGLTFATGFGAGGRNLWQTVLAHGIFNTVALGLFFVNAPG